MRRLPLPWLVLCSLVFLFSLVPTPILAQQDPLQATTRTVNVELILDASGSMGEPLTTGETRMAAAKRILREVITGLPERDGVNVGLRVYGHLGDNTEAGKPVSCRSSELLVPVAGLDKSALVAQVEAIQPTGWTPIAYSLEQAAADFQPGGESITNAIVLVTDGEETCDPPQQSCAAAAALRQSDVTVTTHVVGFALTPQQTELVSCVAEEGGGQLFGADNAEELSTAIGSALEGVGVTLTPAAQLPPVSAAVPLSEIRTLGYHQISRWEAGVLGDGEQAPIISDDGQRIAFARHPGEFAPDPRNRIYVINADGTGEREVDVYPFLCFCGSMIDLSADGTRVVSSEGVQLRVAEASGGSGRELLVLDSGEINGIRISGDGGSVYFRIYRDTTIRNTSPSQPIERGIYVVNADGSGMRQLVGPSQIAALYGIAPEAAPFFGAIWGLDTSYDGSRVVFASYSGNLDQVTGSPREELFAVNGDGSGLRWLLGPTFTYVYQGAINRGGTTVAYVTRDFGTGYAEAGVIGFDGSGRRKLTDSAEPAWWPGVALPNTGDRISLSADGSRLLMGSKALLVDTASGEMLALGVVGNMGPGDPPQLVENELARATMSADASRASYLSDDAQGIWQLAIVDVNPTNLDAAPSITDATITPPYVLTQGQSTAIISARASTPNPMLRLSGRALYQGLPDPNVDMWYYGPMVDDGVSIGDTVAGDGVFTYDGVATNCCAEVGPRIVRVKAETQAADGLRHATAVDVEPFAVVAEPGDVPTPVPPTATAIPATATVPPPTATALPPTATVEATAVPTATGECRWAGTWSTSFGTMRLIQTDGTVSGDYEHDQGQIQGTVSGRVLRGTWDEAPSRQPPTDAGDIEFTLADDCQSFTGRWRYGSSGDWLPGWTGELDATGPTPTPLPTVPPTATSVPPTATAVPPTATTVPPTPIPPTATPPSTVTAGQTPTSPGMGNSCNCDELAAAQATIAAQATRIAELEGEPGLTPPAPTTPEFASPSPTPPTQTPSPTPTPAPQITATVTGTETIQQPPLPADFVTPDPAECTTTPRSAEALGAILAVPNETATDALEAAALAPGLDIPAGQPADEATTVAVAATAHQIVACLNADDYLASYALWTDNALRQLEATVPTTEPPTPVPVEERWAVRVTDVRVLPDGRVVAVWELSGPLFTMSAVQIVARQDNRYLGDELLDLAFE